MLNENANRNARPDWIELAQAKMHIETLARQQEGIMENTREAMLERQAFLAKEITRTNDNHRWGSPEKVNARSIEEAGRQMAEYKKDLERHEILRDAYRMAAAIIDADSGAYFYAAHRGCYRTDLAKFETQEARAAFLEGHDNWHEATDDDLNEIFWGHTVPTDGAPQE